VSQNLIQVTTEASDVLLQEPPWDESHEACWLTCSTNLICICAIVQPRPIQTVLRATTVTCRPPRPEVKCCVSLREQQRVAAGPGNAHCMSIRQVSLRCGTCGYFSVPAASAPAAICNYSSLVQNILINTCAKFHYDRLRNDRALGNRKSDNNQGRSQKFVWGV